jgi:hypothetical protein
MADRSVALGTGYNDAGSSRKRMTQTGSQRRGVKMLRGVDAAGDTAPNVVEYELGVRAGGGGLAGHVNRTPWTRTDKPINPMR